MSTVRSGRHFLQIPGPTNVPHRVLAAIASPTIDHRSREFGELGEEVLTGLKSIFQTSNPVVMFPSSGTGAWEAALTNTLKLGDTVLMYEAGYFASQWKRLALRLGLGPIVIDTDWRNPVDPSKIFDVLKADVANKIKAVCVVHNETSTGVTSDITAVRRAIDEAGHQALLMVDTISSLGSMDYQHDSWGVDVTVGGSQKGLMLPPGLSFNAISKKALEEHRTSNFPRSYWDWEEQLEHNASGFFPYTPATNLIFGLRESLKMLLVEEGLIHVFERHRRHAEATRRAVRAWGLTIFCADEKAHSNTLTAILSPDNMSSNKIRKTILEKFDMSLGTGLGKYADRIFRIGHLGYFNDLMLTATLSGVEMGLMLENVPLKGSGTQVALDYLAKTA